MLHRPVSIGTISLCLIALLLCGCWDRRELDTLAIVAGVGLDTAAEPGQVRMTLQTIKSSENRSSGSGRQGSGGGEGKGEGTGGDAVRIFDSKGDTVFQAIRNITPKLQRQLLFSHAEVIVIGREAAKNGIYPLLDYFSRRFEPRPSVLLAIADGQASDIMRSSSASIKIPAFGLSSALKFNSYNAFTPLVTMQEFTEMLMSKTTAAILPLVTIYEEGDISGKRHQRVGVGGTAVFKGERMVGELDTRQTRGLLWVLDKVKSSAITVGAPGGRVTLNIKGAFSKLTPELYGDVPYVKVELRIDSDVGDQESLENLATPQMVAELEKRQAAAVHDEALAALEQSRLLKADFFGFGEEFHRKYPKEWPGLETRWEELYPHIQVDVTVKSAVHGTGLIGEPLYQQR